MPTIDHEALELALPTLLSLARAGYPYEICGWLTTSELPLTLEIQECQNALKRSDRPVAQRAFELADKDLLRFAQAFDSKHPPLVFYHSHPISNAGMSVRDKQFALGPNGTPAYAVAQLILAKVATKSPEAVLYQYCQSKRAYHVEWSSALSGGPHAATS